MEAIIAQSDSPEIEDLLALESLADLKGLARHLGIRSPSKERKLDLSRRIANHIENQRGYRLLRGSDSKPI